MRKVIHILTTLTGIILLLTGVTNVAGVLLPESLQLNPVHTLIHILLGSISIFILWMKNWLYTLTALILGVFFLIFSIVGLLAPNGVIHPNLTVNAANNLTHPLYAAIFLAAAYLNGSQIRVAVNRAR